VHEVLKQWNRARWRKETLSVEQLQKVFEKSWVEDQRKEKVTWQPDEERDEKKMGWALLKTYFNQSPIMSGVCPASPN
jgi:putative RecB family exonuclease